jgi:hypothetical protein
MMWCEQNRRSWSPSVRPRSGGLSVSGVVTSEVACPFTRILNSFVYSGRVPRVVNGLDAEVGPIGRSLWSLGLIKLGRKPMTSEPCVPVSISIRQRPTQQTTAVG